MNTPQLRIASINETPGEAGEVLSTLSKEPPANAILDYLTRESVSLTESQKFTKDALEKLKDELSAFDEDYHRRRELLVAGIDGVIERLNEYSATLDEVNRSYRSFQAIANAPQANTKPVQGRKVSTRKKAAVK